MVAIATSSSNKKFAICKGILIDVQEWHASFAVLEDPGGIRGMPQNELGCPT
jgi:hypothetical protein